jgi:hypothetical protein
MIKYDITLTMLSFFIFGNVLPRAIAKNPVKFCYLSSQILENFENQDGEAAFFG